MKSKTKRLTNIFHQFIKGTELEGKVHLKDATECLVQAGLIEKLPLGRYLETDRMKAIDHNHFAETVYLYLKEYALNKGLLDERR